MSEKSTSRGLSYRWKLTFHFIALSGALLVASLFLLDRFVDELVVSKVSSDYARAMSSAQQLVALRLQTVNDSLESALSDSVFRSELARARESGLDLGLSARPAAKSVASSNRLFASATLPLFVKSHALAILTDDGTLIYSRARPELHGMSWANLPYVERVRNGERVIAVTSGRDQALVSQGLLASSPRPVSPMLLMGLPIRSGESLLGILLVAEPFSESLFPQLETLSGADVHVDLGTGSCEGSKGSIERSEVPWIDQDSGKVRVADLRGSPHLMARLPLRDPESGSAFGYALLTRPLAAEMGEIRRGLNSAFFKILLLSILASAIAASLLSRRVTHALTSLRDGVRRVQNGDLSVELAARSRDEFGQLTRAFNEMTAGLRQKELLKSSFERYVASPVVEEIIRTSSAPELKGERKIVTALFSDVEGFTSLSETGDPAWLVGELNGYLSMMTEQVRRNGGTVDKFVGDAVMAIWGFSGEGTTGPALACRTALAIQAAGHPWVTRIGIHAGEAIVGNIGSKERLQYTAIGDNVNVAARLEGLNKLLGTRILVSGPARDSAGDAEVLWRDLGELSIRGKKEPMRVHEPFALLAAATKEFRDFCRLFNEAVALRLSGDHAGAQAAFESCRRMRPQDPASAHFLAEVRRPALPREGGTDL